MNMKVCMYVRVSKCMRMCMIANVSVIVTKKERDSQCKSVLMIVRVQ